MSLPPVSIIVLARNRPELTAQTLKTLQKTLAHTKVPHELIIVDNASDSPTQKVIRQFRDSARIIRVDDNVGVGGGKNLGVEKARYDHFYISDNDLYYFTGWLDHLVHTSLHFPPAKVIGAFRHPHHGLVKHYQRDRYQFEQSNQQVGSSWFLTRETWNTFGPLDTDVPVGTDDVSFINRVTKAGFMVGSIAPHRAFHCGATNTTGGWSPGGENWSQDQELLTTLPRDIIIK